MHATKLGFDPLLAYGKEFFARCAKFGLELLDHNVLLAEKGQQLFDLDLQCAS